MRHTSTNRILLRSASVVALAAGAWLGATSMAAAQAAPAAPTPAGPVATAPQDQAAIVTVTATRRAENVQKEPVAVSALGGRQLEQAGVQDFKDLQNITPSLAVAQAPGGFNFINIRGVGVGVATPFQSAGVPLMVDGMYLPHSENFILDEYFDIGSVELYRGPQGTFAGQNSTGGAIFVNAVQPSFSGFGGWIQQLVGNYNWYQTQGAVNLPLNDQFAARVSLNAETRDGFTKNLGPEGVEPGSGHVGNPGNLDKVNLRAILRWKPNDKVDIKLRYDYDNSVSNGAPDIDAAPETFNNPSAIAHPWTVSYDYPQYTKLVINRVILNTQWQLNDDVELKTITGYQEYDYNTGADADGGSPFKNALTYSGPGPQTAVLNSTLDKYWTAEADLVSTNSGPLQWVVGADYLHQDTPIHTTIKLYISPFGPNVPLTIYPDGGGGVEELNYYQQDTSYAGFGEIKYNFSDQLQLIVGGRVTYYEVEVDPPSNIDELGTHTVLASCLAPPHPANLLGLCNISAKAPYTQPTGRIVLNWFATPETTAYVSASRGFKQGGYVTQYDEGAGQHPGYKPETINDYEVGLKTTTFDGHLQFDGDAFYEDYFNYQAPFAVPDGVVPLTLNAQEAQLYGFEASANLSIEDFRASANLSYTHTEVTKDTTPAVVPTDEYGPTDFVPARAFNCTILELPSTRCVTFTGEPMDYAPQWTANLALEYDFHVFNGTLTPRFQVSYIDSQWASLFHASQDFMPAHTTIDLRLAYQAAEHWRVEGFILNATNALYVTGVAAGAQVPFLNQVLLGDPRQYGVRIMYKW
jgi:iron complex outermembrane receptor protein